MKTKVDKAIILAAGMGARLGELGAELPKCLLEVGGKTILGNQLECLERNGIRETIVVVGYMKDKIINQIGNQVGGMKVSYVHNDIFDKTNNIYSLWLARDHMKNGYLSLEGDLFFEDKVIERLVDSPQENTAVLDIVEETMEGTVDTVSQNKVNKRRILKKEQASGFDYRDKFKTVNIYKFSPELGRMVISYLDARISKGQWQDFYEIVLRDMVAEGNTVLYGLLIDDLKWLEVDTIEDLEMAKQLFKKEG